VEPRRWVNVVLLEVAGTVLHISYLSFELGVEVHKSRHVFTLQTKEHISVLGGLCGSKGGGSQESKNLSPEISTVCHVLVLLSKETKDRTIVD